MRLVPAVHSFLRRRVSVSYWLILLVIAIQISLYYRNQPIDLGRLAFSRLAALQATFEGTGGSKDVQEDWGLQLRSIGLTSYTAELRDAWSILFGDGYPPSSSSSGQPVPWAPVARRLALDVDPTLEFKNSIPHRLYTTASVEPRRYPWQFRYWAENDPR